MSAAPDFPPVLTVAPIARAAGVVRLPGSKSISNRALLLAALADGETTLSGLLDAEDTRVMIEALRSLGVRVHADGDAVRVTGCGGDFPQRRAELFLGNAGTAMRSLAAALAFAGGTYRLDGVARMRERPIGDLVEALTRVGARIRYEGRTGYPPLAIEPAPAPDTDTIEVKGEVSSQFVSGILMAAPAIAPAAGLRVRVPGALISQPYVTMTVALMQRFGVDVIRTGAQEFIVPRARYRTPGRLAVEGDASAASYFLALGAIAGGPVRVTGVGRGSVQGDIAFADLLAAMGARIRWGEDFIESAAAPLAGIEHDCTAIPDAAMTAAIVALFAQGRTRLTGIGSWRVKETDRIAAMAAELAKLGAPVQYGADWLAVEGPVAVREATVDTYDDHRIAMCFALAAAGGAPMRIREPGCVAKTFPGFFDALSALVRR
ncbi:MAG: 3-phosphoshikimate 1-carboxyvinyltransferase [Burkholderiaceae bacterium]|nr:3-phosphoshikimate 1-carboxyvinyltransferase [Burkholderiaceae bacterium]